MIYSYPYSSSSKRYYQYQPYYTQRPNNFSSKLSTKNTNLKYNNPQNVENSHIQKPDTSIKKEKNTDSKDDVLFEIFGIKLYFDDILLICLIFFLYNEGVQDQYLIIVLILLLLS